MGSIAHMSTYEQIVVHVPNFPLCLREGILCIRASSISFIVCESYNCLEKDDTYVGLIR